MNKMDSLTANTAAINRLLARYGVKFGIYKNIPPILIFSLKSYNYC